MKQRNKQETRGSGKQSKPSPAINNHQADHIYITLKDKIAITDHEKCEMFKSLLSETMIEHQYENEDLQKHFLETEQNTKCLIETEPKELTAEKIFLKVEEFNEILKNTSKSCPGPDKISYQLLKALPKSIKALICIIISSSINNSYVPCLWKDSQVTMLPKPKKTKKAENYRPISLTNCIAKVCETVFKNLILDHCEANKVFGPQQSAYRANGCTTDNLLVLTQHISEAYQWSEMVGIVCLDVEKSF